MHQLDLASLNQIKQKVYAYCGLQFEGTGQTRLQQAASKEMQAAKINSGQAYLQALNSNQRLFQSLINQLTINETFFYRESEQLDLLTRVLLPKIIANTPASKKIKILSLGSSSGEEVYSLAIALIEAFGSQEARNRFHLDAADIDTDILAKARKGLYTDFSFRSAPAFLKQKYFTKADNHYQLNADILSRVKFHQLNLLTPNYPAELNGYSVVFFRNVAIYFDLATRKTIHQQINKILLPGGYLFLASSETLGNNLGVFKLTQEDKQYFFTKPS